MRVNVASPIDDVSGALTVVDHAEEETHEGKTYTLVYTATKNNAETIIIHFKTPSSNARCHLAWQLRSTAGANMKLIEGADVTVAGTAVTSYCMRRDDVKTTPAALTYHTPTYSGGTDLPTWHVGVGQIAGGSLDHKFEWILAPGLSYIFLVTSEGNTNEIALELDWYEEEDKWR